MGREVEKREEIERGGRGVKGKVGERQGEGLEVCWSAFGPGASLAGDQSLPDHSVVVGGSGGGRCTSAWCICPPVVLGWLGIGGSLLRPVVAVTGAGAEGGTC